MQCRPRAPVSYMYMAHVHSDAGGQQLQALFDLCMASACISKRHMHESHSERALHSQVIRIRLPRQITVQNAPIFAFQKA